MGEPKHKYSKAWREVRGFLPKRFRNDRESWRKGCPWKAVPFLRPLNGSRLRVSNTQPRNPSVLEVEEDAVGSGVPLTVCDLLTVQNDSYKHVLERCKKGSPSEIFRAQGLRKVCILTNTSCASACHLWRPYSCVVKVGNPANSLQPCSWPQS